MTDPRPVLRLLLLAAAAPAAVRAQAEPLPLNHTLIAPAPDATRAGGPHSAAFERARQGVVHVVVEVRGRNVFQIERPSSGVLIGNGGLVLTHWALVREAPGSDDKSLWVRLPDATGTRLPATLVAHDAASGLALLRAKATEGRELQGFVLAEAPAPGDPVGVLAFPDGEDLVGFAGVATPAQGDVAVGRGDDARTYARDELLLTDAAIQRRCHGAAMFDAEGRLVGICSADAVVEDVAEPTLEDLKRPSFGFALPVRTAKRVFAEHLGSQPLESAEPSKAARLVATIGDAIVAVSSGGRAREALGSDDPYATRRRPGVGSGIVVDSSGLVLTNRHVIARGDPITVTFRDGTEVTAELLEQNRATNSALLRLRLPEGRRVAALRRGSNVAVGDPVLAIGNPEGHSLTVGAGVLSAKRGDAIQTDAPMGNHNGGGALVSLDGRLIAMLDAGLRDQIDIAFAQRGDQAKIDTSLNVTPSIEQLWKVHREALLRHTTDDGAAEAGAVLDAPIARMVDQAGPSMLNIYVQITTAPAELEDNPFATPEPRVSTESLGSGVIIDASGLALTNWHVVDSATEPDGSMPPDRLVRVALRDGRAFPARVLSISREEDLALLQLELGAGEQVRPVPLGSSAALEIGDTAVAIGNPHGRANTVTAGIVTARNQSIRVRGRWAKLPHLIETDAAINAGNSGGALLDREGRLIGINSAGGSLFAVTGYAIAVDHVREKLHSVLLTPEKLRSPYVGLTVTDHGERPTVHSLDPHGPAARAGVQKGDVVVAIAGEPVRWSVGFAMQVLGLAPGTPAALELERGGERVQVDVVPLSAAQWAVLRQTGVEVDELSIRDDAERIHAVSLAFYRAFTGDPSAAPSMIPRSLVRVARLHPRLSESDEPVDLQVGDLLLGVQIEEERRAGVAGRVERFTTPADAQRVFNDHSTYEGRIFRAWIAREGEVRLVELPAKRLII